MTSEMKDYSPADSGQKAESQPGPPLIAKKSNATRIWLLVVATVLSVLWLQMRNNASANDNLVLSGDSTIAGAQVRIDGKNVGQMSRSNDDGLGGAIFYAHVSDGQHTVEVLKDGFQPFTKDISMHGEDYEAVDLKSNHGASE